MDTFLIHSTLGADPIVKKYFIGVFAADQLPKTRNLPPGSIIISNTQSSTESGEHWVLFQIKDLKTIIYFDTSGREYTINKYFRNFIKKNRFENVEFSKFQIQAAFTNTCGLYVCVLALHLAHKCTFQHFLNLFSLHNLLYNDYLIAKMFFKNFDRKHFGIKNCTGSLCIQSCRPLKWAYK